MLNELMEQGKALAAEQKLEAALERFRKALEVSPGDETVLFEMGKTYYMLRDYASAEQVLLGLFSGNAGNVYVPLLLGKTYRESGRRKRALEIYEEMLEKGLLNAETCRELGDLYRNEKEYEMAEYMYEKLLTFVPGDPDVLARLAELYNFEGKHDKAGEKATAALAEPGLDACRANRLLNEREIAENRTTLVSKPRIMLVTLTNRCNLHCPMCGRTKTPWNIPDALRDELISLLPTLELITWQGGEVFLYPHFSMLLDEAAKNRRLKQIIITNGLLIDEPWAERLVAAGNIDLTISIDSVIKNTYEKLRYGGTFEKLLANIRLLNRLRESRPANMTLTLRCAIMQDNYRELDSFLEFCREYRFDVLLIFPVSGEKDPGNIFARKDREALLHVRNARERMQKKAEEYGIRLLNWLPHIEVPEEPVTVIAEGTVSNAAETNSGETMPEECVCPGFAPEEGKRKPLPLCFRPWRQIAVNVGGDIFPECLCPDPLGNIFENSFLEVWNGGKMQEYRRQLAVGDHRCCSDCCRSGAVPPEHLKFICG